MTILIAGASGFLGHAVLGALGEPAVLVLRGLDVEGRARTLKRRTRCDVTGVAGDVRFPDWGLGADVLDRLRGEVRAVVNLAGDVGWSSPWPRLYDNNVRGAAHGVDVAARLGVPLVNASSLFAAYGFGSEIPELLVDEGEHLTKYERSKLQGEWAVYRGARAKGVPARIVRIPALSGDVTPMPGVRAASTRPPFPRLIYQGAWPFFPFAADARLDLCPRDLVARRIVELLDREIECGFQVHNIGQGADAPMAAALVDETRVTMRRLGGRMPRPVRVPPRTLLAVSAQADRLPESLLNAALVGLRYFASPAIYVSEGLGTTLSVPALIRTLGFPRPHEPEPLGAGQYAYYRGWTA